MKSKYPFVILAITIAGCDISMPGADIQRAIELCEPNGGINHLTTKVGGAILKCNNGASFRVIYDD